MKKILIILLLTIASCSSPKTCCSQNLSAYSEYLKDFDLQKSLKKHAKFATVYGAINGGTSKYDIKTFSVTSGQLQEGVILTPYDYSLTIGVRKIARFGYENRANTFYDGTESNYTDAATVGKVQGFEYLFEIDYARQQGLDYIDQHHFIRYSSDDDCDGPLCVDHFAAKVEYLKDGFADVEYFELSERYRYKHTRDLSFSIGAAHRLAEPYGYDPLAEWMLSNGNLHYTYLAIQEGYTIDVANNEYKDPSGNVVANSAEVWKEIVIPQVLANYTEKKRNELKNVIQHSVVVGFDYYQYNKNTWLHAWGNLMPWHYNDGSEFSYHNYIEDEQWYDYSAGLIYGIKVDKQLGYFVEGKYNKYWNREWYDFKFGINYIIR
tara:strand:+ start:274 stop:1407 length:1134 start_codon:yes stop_codon:yes gene_type:complete